MQIEKRLKNYYKRWNINLGYEEEFLKFKNRLIDVINRFAGDYLAENPSVDKYFLESINLEKGGKPHVRVAKPRLSVISESFNSRRLDDYTNPGSGDTHVYRCIDACETPQELALVVQILFWALESKCHDARDMALEIAQVIRKISILTPSASFTVYRRGNQYTVYPNVDPFIDEGVIDLTLSMLEDYPSVAKPFERALVIHLSGKASQYRNLLDDLRFSLEQLLKIVLKNQKSLENQKDELLPGSRTKVYTSR
ncbi:MAG: hypothetical protein KME47_20260 [Nodosilinea sp. WJT8-NPBG4]|jgi:hypothetical protein|nr:hypothetical protein [Nodosilinea sp. WJT8-NPBG4]